MKTRNGFVSNSSTTSFSIYGFSTDNFIDDSGEADYDIVEGVVEKFKNADLEAYLDEPGVIYVGQSWSTIDDNETGKQFKDKVTKLIKDCIKDNKLKLGKITMESIEETIAS